MPARRNLQHVIDSAIDFAIIVTDLDGIVTAWNAEAERIFGWRNEEMLGTSAELIFTARDKAAGRFRDEMRMAVAEDRPSDERWHLRRMALRPGHPAS